VQALVPEVRSLAVRSARKVRPSRSTLKALYFPALRLLGRERALLERLRSSPALVVLNLHQVSPHRNPFWPALQPTAFDALLRFLVRHFHVTSLDELPMAPPDTPAAILSFDDGYQSFMEHALPLLEKYGLRANQNVIPECVESGRAPWNVELYDRLEAAPVSVLRELRLPGFQASLAGDGADEKTRYGVALSRYLKLRPRDERLPLLHEVGRVLGQVAPARRTRMMTRDDVRQVGQRHDIGAHSFAHDSMEFESEEFFEQDTLRCMTYFADALDLPLETYAFPNGSHRDSQVASLQSKGIRNVLLVEERIADRRVHDGVFPRLTISAEGPVEARFQAMGYRSSPLPRP
jgi:peptidoglycan/xylan/chitin deacetylase (PgdA/CDA1 family)